MKHNKPVNRLSAKIDSLQAIRAFASISVMLFHGTVIIHERLNYLFLNNLFIAGFSGVDIFFVLSGFIILYTSHNKTIDSTSFLQKRFVRIYPIYWLVTLFLVIAFFMSPTVNQAHKGDSYTILGSLFLLPQKQYILGVAWTLAYEVIFYLLFAFTYLKKPSYLFYCFKTWIIFILVSYFFNLKTGSYFIDWFLNPVILNFALGCILAYVYIHIKCIKSTNWYFWIGLILFTTSWLVYYQFKINQSNLLNEDISRVFLFGIPSTLLIYGSLHSKINVPKWIVYLGDASYSLYLVHGTILSILIKILIKLDLAPHFNNFLGALSLFIYTLILSCCFYSLVEKKLLNFLNNIK